MKAEEEEDYTAIVYGDGHLEPPPKVTTKKKDFAPWHHPIKQIVRDYQWSDAAVHLLSKCRSVDQRGVLRYFTLPGVDLFDVRQLTRAIKKLDSQIEYFGFNEGWQPDSDDLGTSSSAHLSAESSLRQAGRITASSVVLPDRLEDIAQPGSTAADRLKQQAVFDIVNIDACNHLGYASQGRKKTIFDAMEKLLEHQLRSETPWLLFLTTRADPKLLGGPAIKLQAAIQKNLDTYPEAFGKVLADCIEIDEAALVSNLVEIWGAKDERFLRLFVLALGKHLLQYYCGQPSFETHVELTSVYCYRVHGEYPDMISVVFRVTPKGLRIHPASAQPMISLPTLELAHAEAIALKAKDMWNLEGANGICKPDVTEDAVVGTRRLLKEANYDLDAWKLWLESHSIRPMTV